MANASAIGTAARQTVKKRRPRVRQATLDGFRNILILLAKESDGPAAVSPSGDDTGLWEKNSKVSNRLPEASGADRAGRRLSPLWQSRSWKLPEVVESSRG